MNTIYSCRNHFAVGVCLAVLSLFAGVADAADPNLVSWWRFDEGSGSTAYDSAGGNHGSLVNGPAWTSGRIGGTLRFDGSDDWVSISNPGTINSESDFTWVAWIQTSSDTGAILARAGMGWAWERGGKVFFLRGGSLHFDVGWVGVVWSGVPVNDGQWHHVVVTVEFVNGSDTISFYVDGVSAGDGNLNVDRFSDSGLPLKIGFCNGDFPESCHFNGIIDDVHIYDRALSAEEIMQIYGEGLGGRAFNPEPEDGATYVLDPNMTVLSWMGGTYATSHDVYFGTNYSDVNDATTDSAEYMGNQYDNSYWPGPLELGTTYYWRIDEVGPGGTIPGSIWSFTAGMYAYSVNASDMVFKSSGSRYDGDGWELSSNGYLGTFIKLESPETITVTVRAAGREAEGISPKIDLHVADYKVSWDVSHTGTSYGDYRAKFNLPVGMHWLRIEFVNAKAGENRNLYVRDLHIRRASLHNTASHANALAAADSYIENFRRGPAKVSLTRVSGSPMPAGTEVRVKLRRHAFDFGTADGAWLAPWVTPNPPVGSDYYNYQQFLDSHFNMIVPEVVGKWRWHESTRDVVTMGTLDALLDYAEQHGLRARMHTVLWSDNPSEPDWVNTLQVQALTDPDAADEYWDEIMERIGYLVGDRAERYTDVDGINESYHRPIHTQIYGIEGVASLYNEMVAASGGRAKIAVNEWGVLERSGYSNWYRRHIQDILDAGGSIGLIGIQNHTSGHQYNAVGVFKDLQLLAGFELPMIVTEFSLSSPDSTVLTETMRLVFGNDWSTGFVTWGFWRPCMWRKGSALVDEGWNLTDMGIAYEQLMAQWDTDETVYTDANSQIYFTGFYGDYDLILNKHVYSLVMEEGTIEYTIVETIQGAIDAASNGDTIVVQPGVYNENINFRGKNLTLISEDPNDPNVVANTVINGSSQGSVVTFSGGEDANCVLAGFTITGGVTSGNGGGVSGNRTLAGISNCVIKNNSAYRGGGLASFNGTIDECIIIGNLATNWGGGMNACHGKITNCLIYGNSGSRGGGMSNCDGEIINCTIVSNTATEAGGGLRRCDGTIRSCIIWNNVAVHSSQIHGYPNPTYSCIQDWTGGGTGNIDADPCFAEGSWALLEGMVSYWKFNEGSGSTAYDSAGENHGTLVNGPAWTSEPIGGALIFDGVNDYIDVAHSPDFNIETGFTVELWFKAKPTQLSPDKLFAVIDKSHRSTESPPYWSGWIMQGRVDIDIGRLWFGIGNGTDFPGVSTNTSVLDDIWHHVAGVFDGTKVKLYFDGVLQGTAVLSGTPVNNTGPLNIGRWATEATRNFNGHIDEVAIYNRALSAAEIGRLYGCEFLWRRWGLIGWPDPHLLPGPGHYHLLRTSPCVDAANDANVYTDIEGNIRPFDFPGVDNNGELPEFDMGGYELTPVEAEMQLTPQKLNCKSKGKFVKAHITLPEGFAPEDVALDTPALAYPVNLESEYLEVFVNDYGLVEIEVAFDRRSFCDSLTDDSFVTEDGYLNVTVLGSLTTGQYFYGADTIRIMSRR